MKSQSRASRNTLQAAWLAVLHAALMAALNVAKLVGKWCKHEKA
jgi:hypothetical protein